MPSRPKLKTGLYKHAIDDGEAEAGKSQEQAKPLSSKPREDPPTSEQASLQRRNSLRQDTYSLGDIARTPRDMVIYREKDEAARSASLLKKHDSAFLKRSNGLW